MRIAFEASSFIGEKPTGVSVYIKNFLESFISLNTEHSIRLLYKLSRLKHKKKWQKIEGVPTQTYYESILPILKKADIVHGLDCYVPNWKNSKRIVNFYDIFPLIDKRNFISPKSFRLKKEEEYRYSVSVADLIITSSENTKKDLINYFQVNPSKINCVYPGLDLDFFQRQPKEEVERVRKFHNLKKDYLLFVGSVSARKNTANLVEAFSRSKAKNDFDLVLAGSVSFNGEYTLEAIEKNNLGEKVKILGYVPEEHIAALYSGAKAFLFPTFYEGFGFPILEAMLCGVPILTSNVGSAPEIGGKFATYVNPSEIEDIASGIDSIIENSNFNADEARKYTENFNWESTAQKMLKIYESISQK